MPIIPESDPNFSYHRNAAETESERNNRQWRRLAGGKRKKSPGSRAKEAMVVYGRAKLPDDTD